MESGMDTSKALQELVSLEHDQTIRCKAITLLRALEGDRDLKVNDTEWFRRYVIAKGASIRCPT